MAPRLNANEDDQLDQDQDGTMTSPIEENPINEATVSKKPYKMQIVWRNVILMSLLHLGSIVGLYLLVSEAKWLTWLWCYILLFMSATGITAGAHRLFSHKSYKAKYPLKVILMIFNCVSFQNDIIEWARDHRVHHKYSETDADPHNAVRGFFFAHIGWLLVKKHQDVKDKGKGIDMSDLTSDPLLMFQRRHYKTLVLIFSFIIPTFVPLLWGETLFVSFYTAALLRYAVSLNFTWCVNSVAHMWGNRPYDQHISPRQSVFTAIGAFGEGWHNYHHTFPYDYRTSEFPYTLNPTSLFIDFFYLIGWAYDRKTVSLETIQKKMLRSGDGSTTPFHKH